RPPLVQLLERAPGQREERYVHLLSGPVETTAVAVAAPWQPATSSDSDLEARVRALEEEVAALRAKIGALGGGQ
ncbi:MAG: DUF480 domain-containing protein, partial [Mesorhizobium sp.]